MTRAIASRNAGRIPAVQVALPAAARAAACVPLSIHLPQFATEVVGPTLGRIDLVRGLIHLVDVVPNPLLGRLTDRVASLAPGGPATAAVWVFAVVPANGGAGALIAGHVLTFAAHSLGAVLACGQSVGIAGGSAPMVRLRPAGAREFGTMTEPARVDVPYVGPSCSIPTRVAPRSDKQAET